MSPSTPGPTARHRVACAGFLRVAELVRPDQWAWPTPCSRWDTSAIVEHVIGFHEFLVLRPLGVRAHRPRSGPAARWAATSKVLFATLDAPGALDRTVELPGGGQSSPRTMLAALTTDVLVHTWDLARAVGVDPALDPDLCVRACDAGRRDGIGSASEMFAAQVPVAVHADPTAKLVALYGRDPAWVAR